MKDSITNSGTIELFGKLMRAFSQDDNPSTAMESIACQELVNIFHDYMQSSQLKPGDVVRWKSNLRNKRLPNYFEPAVVVEVLETPVIDTTQDFGSPYYLERLDVKLGVLNEEGDFVCFLFDSNRFEKMIDDAY